MRLIFAGTPEFAAVTLRSLLDGGHQVVLVVTQPDRPTGRGMQVTAGAVKRLAEERGLPLYQPEGLKDPASHERLRSAGADLMVVAAYGLILPQAVLDLPRLGCLNVHASLLPRWRGAAPIQRAIEAGDPQTGVSIMRMEAGLDCGAVLLSHAVPIGAEDTAATVHDRLALLGGTLIVSALADFDRLPAIPQPEAGVTYAPKITKQEAALDWRRSAQQLERQVRAFNPFPVASTRIRGVPLKVYGGTQAEQTGDPGSVLEVNEGGIVVGCGRGSLRLTELQQPGGRRLPARDFLNGFSVAPGMRCTGS